MQSSLKLIGFKRSILLLNRFSKKLVSSRSLGDLSRQFSISNKRCFSTTSSDVPPVVTSSLYYREEILELLQLKTFTEEEWRQSFQSLQIDQADNTIELKESLTHLYQQKVPWLPLNNKKIEVLASEILPKKTHPSSLQPSLDNIPSHLNKRITFDQYKQYLTKYSERLDKRVWNIGMSFLLTGVSVGVIIPCMPLLVSQLQISPSSFGFVISAFGLSKLLGNVPSGFLVEKYGRTAVVTSGLVLCGLANCAISFIFLPGFGTPWLVFCRFLAGIGVSGFIAGGQMIMSDISTHLNRTRTIAPVMASFSAGTAFGPAIGGILVDTIGLTYTYATVGACFGLIALQNQLTMKETKRVKLLDQRPSSSNNIITSPSSSSSSPSKTMIKAEERPKMSSEILKSFKTASNAWKELLHIPQIKNMIILNTVFWFAMSGAQFTLLPLHLVSNTFNFTSFEIGSCFAYSSIVSFLASQPIAYLSDKYGKQKVMIAGMTLVSSSVLSLSFTSNLTELLVVLTPLAAGITSMNAATPALMTELTTSEQRAQGLSLLRTASDIGFLFGAVFSGYVASHFDLSTAFLTDGTTVLSAMIWFYLRNKLVTEASSSSSSSNDNDKKRFQ